MAFFLETLIGGLMAGMLYALVALGFVLIFKASGVFNFAQGAMVLFAALAMARFAEWVPQWLGFDSRLLANLIAFALAGGLMRSACSSRLLFMRRLRPVMMLSSTLMPLNSARFWKVRAMPICATWWLFMWAKVSPRKVMLPSLGV